MEKLKREYEVTIKQRCFPFHTDVPDKGLLIEEMFPDITFKARDMTEKMRKTAEQFGLPFGNLEKIYNTRFAQEIGQWAESKGHGVQFHEAVFKAYFVDGRDISSISVLKDLAASAGLPEDEVERNHTERPFRDHVNRDWSLSRKNDVMAIPTLLLNNNKLVGAQPYEVIERFVKENGAGKRS